MMKINKDKIDFKYIIIGILSLGAFLLPNNNNIIENDLVLKEIIVKYDIKDISSRKSEKVYRINDKENSCSFVIDKIGAIAAKWNNLDNIIKNDTLQIQIHKNSLNKLDSKVDIFIYSLIKNNQLIFDLYGYNKEQNVYDKKWDTTFIIGSVLLIFLVLRIISKNVAFIMIVISVVIFLILNHLDKW